MRALKFVSLFVFVAVATSAFTYSEAPRFHYQAPVSHVTEVLHILNHNAEVSDFKVPLQNLKMSNRTISFAIKGEVVKMAWVGSTKVALKINEIELTPREVLDKNLIKNKLLQYVRQSPSKRRHAQLWRQLLLPQAHAQVLTGQTFDQFMAKFNAADFNRFLGALTQLAAAFAQWQMNPTNPYGFHSSQMPNLIQIPKVPVGY